MLTSFKADTSRIDGKLKELSEMLTEHVSDEIFGVLSRLPDNVILVDSSATIGAGGVVDVVCFFDFDGASYNEVITAIRALKVNNIAH
ncbi:hypothetical protein KFO32_05650 [Pantoea ananatis]|nr:hypothetical protein [Pantoea ananatis]MCK0552559.1 hypothetical protein [Pantoea ananatis]